MYVLEHQPASLALGHMITLQAIVSISTRCMLELYPFTVGVTG